MKGSDITVSSGGWDFLFENGGKGGKDVDLEESVWGRGRRQDMRTPLKSVYFDTHPEALLYPRVPIKALTSLVKMVYDVITFA